MSFTANIDDVVAENRNHLLGKHPKWERVRLKEVATILNGYPFESGRFKRSGGTPLIRIRDILDGRTETFYDGEFDSTFLVKRGEILIGMDGDFHCEPWAGEPALLNQRVCKITPDESRYAKQFLRYLLPGYLSAINAQTPSVTVKHLSSRTIADIPLPIPPMPEQRRIVAEIEKQFTRLEAGGAALRRVQANLKRYRAAVLKAACEGKLVSGVEAQWRTLPLEEACLKITDGDHQPPPKVSDGIPFLTIGNISSGRLDFSDTRFVPQDYFAAIKFDRLPKQNDVLYSVVGATIGIPVLVNTAQQFCFQRHIALLKPSKAILPKFLWIFMASPKTFQQAWARTTGSAQPTLPLKALRSLPITLPPLAEQARIVAEVERRLSVVEELERVVLANLQRATRLRQSILQKAFAGELLRPA